MTRREVLFCLRGLGGATLLTRESFAGRTDLLPSFWKSCLADVDRAMKQAKKGHVRLLAKSAGQRDIYLVTYGQKDNLASTANYNSACGGKDPASYRRKDGKQKPVVFLLGPVHGQEIEGVVGLMNLLAVAETGQDLYGREWPDLAGMGTRADGTNYVWPMVKRFHPMQGARVGELGSYFNDHGINLMHDDWFEPMAAETQAYLRLAQDEAPDFIVSLHSHNSRPSVEPTAYVPRTVKETIRTFANRLYARYRTAGLPAREGGPEPEEDGATFPPPSFNLASALHHACGGAAFVHECPSGVKEGPPVTHEQILAIKMLLYEELFQFAVQRPVRWL